MGPRCASASPTPHLHIVLSLLHPLVTPSEAVRHSSPSSISSSLPSSIASPDPPRSLPPSKPRHTDECKTKTHLPFTFLFLRSPCKYGPGTAATCTTVVERRWAHFFPQPTTLHGHDPPRGRVVCVTTIEKMPRLLFFTFPPRDRGGKWHGSLGVHLRHPAALHPKRAYEI